MLGLAGLSLSGIMAVSILLSPLYGAAVVRNGPLYVSHCPVGSLPEWTAFNPVTHRTYVANLGGGTITVLKSPCAVGTTIKLPKGSGPTGIAFSPINNDMYVADGPHNRVYVISGTAIVATIASSSTAPFTYPYAIAYDPGDAIMMVTNYNSNTVTAIYGTSVLGNIAVGSNPDGIAYDPYYSSILVADYSSSNVTILSAVYPFSGGHSSVGAGSAPTTIVFDPANSYDYVTNEGSHNVTIINGVGSSIGSVGVGSHPIGAVWSQATLHVYVANWASDNVSILSGTSVVATDALPTNSGPFGMSYDWSNNYVYVTGDSNNTAYVLS